MLLSTNILDASFLLMIWIPLLLVHDSLLLELNGVACPKSYRLKLLPLESWVNSIQPCSRLFSYMGANLGSFLNVPFNTSMHSITVVRDI